MPRKNATRSLVEERFAFTGGTVDRSDPNRPKVVGALLCGRESANSFLGDGKDRVQVKGRRYLQEAFSGERVKKYNGKPVFLNHPAKPHDHRDYRDKIAVVENARHRSDGMPVGDLAINPKHPHAEQFLWDAENSPNSCGMSHRAWFKWRTSSDNFAEAVELEEAISVDLVVDPATTSGVFEHKEKTMSTFATLQEWLTRNPKSTADQILKVKKLAALGNYATRAVQEMDEGASGEDGVTTAIKTAAAAEIEECMASASSPEAVKSCLKRLKKILHLHGDLNEPEEDAEGGKEEPKKEPPAESKQIGYERAIGLCSESKYSATPTEYKLIAKFDTEADAKAFIAEQAERSKSVAETKPRSTGRTVATPPKQVTEESRSIPAWNSASSRN